MRPEADAPISRDAVLELDVDGLGDGGDGLARVRGYVVFVRGALPGERVRARVVSAGAKNGRAEVLEVLAAAPERVTPRCPHFGNCGGCQLQHVAYGAQLDSKRVRLGKALAHALRREVDVPAVLAPQDAFGQRTKVALHVERQPSGYRVGLYGMGSRRLVALDECPAAERGAFEVARRALQVCEQMRVPAWDPRTGEGAIRGALLRTTSRGERGLVLISADEFLPRERAVVEALGTLGLVGLWLNHNPSPRTREGGGGRIDAFEVMHLLGPRTRSLAGAEWLEEEVNGVRYLASPDAFFQTSRFGAPALVDLVRTMLAAPADATVIDAYCGGGLLSLAIAGQVKRVIGIEDDRGAVADAERSAQANGIANARFLAGPAQRLLPTLASERPFAVIVDPPRSGCHVGVLETVVGSLRPRRVLYVACDIAALARDAAFLERAEYALTRVQPLDMFPLTQHLETVACFDQNPQIREGKKRFSRSAGQRLLEKARRKPAS